MPTQISSLDRAPVGGVRLEPMFGRHETFAPRAGWFKKVYDGVKANPDVFKDADATLALGVGKNMVRSMRFWAGAAALVAPRRVSRTERLRPTHLADVIFADDGWDPYLENPSTLWLLHWEMMGPGAHLPVWHFAFTDLQQPDFTTDTLSADALKGLSSLYGIEKAISPASVRRDAECLIHTYARRLSDRVLIDDSLACPFRTLGIIESVAGRAGRYRFSGGRKAGLDDDMILFAALNFAAVNAPGSHSVSIGRLARAPMSPGKVFKLDEDTLLEALSRAAVRNRHVTVVDTAGVSALQFAKDPDPLAVEVLNTHFRPNQKRLLHLRDDSVSNPEPDEELDA